MATETTPSTNAETQPPVPPKKRRLWRILAIVGGIIVLLLLIAGFAAIAYTASAAKPMPEAIAALESDAAVTVTRANWLEFTPTGQTPTTGFIFYPGGHVDPRAYAPPARALAEQGYLVAITPMPLTLAILSPNRADDVIKNHPEIEHWYIGGHSLGGATAAIYADRNPGAVDGVVFWAAYPPDSNSLADQPDLQVTSIYGTLDGLATPAKIEASKGAAASHYHLRAHRRRQSRPVRLLRPPDGDNEATITREEQQTQVISCYCGCTLWPVVLPLSQTRKGCGCTAAVCTPAASCTRIPRPHVVATIQGSVAWLQHLARRLAVTIDDTLAATYRTRQHAVSVNVPRFLTGARTAGTAYRIFRDADLPCAMAGQAHQSRVRMNPGAAAIGTFGNRRHHLLLAGPITGLAARLGRQKIKRIFSCTLAEGAIYLHLLQTNLTRCHRTFLYVKQS